MITNASKQTITRANIYSFLATAFSYPSQEVIEELDKALPLITMDIPNEKQNNDFLQSLVRLRQAMERTEGRQTIQAEYSLLFAGKDKLKLSEVDDEKTGADLAQRLADISAYYLAFGLQVAEGTGERMDFVGTEVEFLHALLLKRYNAEQQGWDEQAAICSKAEVQFLKEHAFQWMPGLAEKLSGQDGFYGALGELLLAFMRVEQTYCIS